MATYHTEDHFVCGSLADLSPADGGLDLAPCFVYVGLGGDLSVIAAADSAPILLKNVPTGSLLPIKVKRVRLTGTTAQYLVAVR